MYILPEKLNSRRELGFTLVETLVALVVLTMATIPALTLSTSAVNIAFETRDRMIATGLTQEGMEVVRAIRDTNFFNNRAFDTGLVDGSYRVEWNSTLLLPTNGNPPLNLNNGLYTYSSGTPTKFTRMIMVTKISSAELKVVSRVDWAAKRGVKTIIVEEHLFDWK